MDAPSVWIVEDGGKDLSEAARFGPLRYVFEPGQRADVFRIDTLRQTLTHAFETARTGDYLVVVGSSLAFGLALHVLLDRLGEVTVLLYGARSQCYEPRTIRW